MSNACSKCQQTRFNILYFYAIRRLNYAEIISFFEHCTTMAPVVTADKLKHRSILKQDHHKIYHRGTQMRESKMQANADQSPPPYPQEMLSGTVKNGFVLLIEFGKIIEHPWSIITVFLQVNVM